MGPRDWLRSLTNRTQGNGEPPPRRRGPGGQPPIRRTGLGLLLIAFGRRDGLQDFGNTPDAYLASLAPLIAFALVSSVLTAAAGHIRMAVQVLLIPICWWLTPAVISHPLCRLWGRAGDWPRYANILNWSQILLFLVLAVVSAVAKTAITAGLPEHPVLVAGVAGFMVYAVWFHWFVARGTLHLSRWRTLVLLVLLAVGTNLVISVPLLATGSGWAGFVLP